MKETETDGGAQRAEGEQEELSQFILHVTAATLLGAFFFYLMFVSGRVFETEDLQSIGEALFLFLACWIVIVLLIGRMRLKKFRIQKRE